MGSRFQNPWLASSVAFGSEVNGAHHCEDHMIKQSNVATRKGRGREKGEVENKGVNECVSWCVHVCVCVYTHYSTMKMPVTQIFKWQHIYPIFI